MFASKQLRLTGIFGGVTTVLATILGISTPANAVLTPFSDRASWEAAVGTFSIEDFNSVTSDRRFDTEKFVGDLRLEGRDGSENDLLIDAQPLETPDHNINGTTQIQGRTELIGAGQPDFFTIDFIGTEPMRAFGASFNDVSDGGSNTTITVGSDTINIPDAGNNAISFFGFVADETFTTVSFDSTTDAADVFGMDDVVYSSVPFEFSPTLGLFAMGGIWSISRLRKKIAVSKITEGWRKASSLLRARI